MGNKMAILEIRKYGDPVLRETAKPIEEVTDELRRLAEDMGETMYSAAGIGLAANQVGDLRRILVIDVRQSDDADTPRARKAKRSGDRPRHLEVYLNPEILESSELDGPYTEGCLSIPEVEGEVYRPLSIKLRWMDLDGEIHEEEVDEIRARVLQHEIDHLNGVLFVDHLGTVKRKLLAGKLNRIKKATMAMMEG